MQVWTTDDGLPQNSITDIVQSRDGYLWLGTFAGLVRFDGVRFKVFDLANTDGIVSNRITQLCEDDDGTLWFGTEEGILTRYRDGLFTSFEPPDQSSVIVVNDLISDGAGGVWVAAWNGLSHFENGEFHPITYEDGHDYYPLSLLVDSSGKLWVGTEEGLAVLENGRLRLHFPGARAQSLNEDADGRLWFRRGHEIGELNGKELKKHSSQVGEVQMVHIGRTTGRLWIGGLNGLGILGSPGTMAGDYHRMQGPLARISFRAIFEDRERNLWVGTNSGGLMRFNDRRVHRLVRDRNDFGSGVTALAVGDDGTVVVGAGCGGARQLIDNTYSPFPDFDAFRNGACVHAMAGDDRGSLWIEYNGRVSRRRNGVWRHYDEDDGLPGRAIHTLHVARDGTLWAGELALYRLENERFTMIPETKDTVERIRSIFDADDGAIWFGGWKGVGRYHQGDVTHYTPDDGLGKGQVRAIYEGDGRTMWFGTYGGGLTRLKDGRFTRITIEHGLFDNTVSKILPDDDGNLWMNGNHGIFAASLSELNAFADGEISEVQCLSVDSGEGNGAAGLRTDDGRMWFPTIDGVAVVDPANVGRNDVPPNVVIESVVADGIALESGEWIHIPPGRRDIEVRYTGLSFVEPEKVRFRYRLEGYDKDWVYAGTRRVAYFTNLSPGDFRFRVMACNNDGVWNEAEASIAMTLAPHFHETAWFIGACLVFIGGLSFAAYRLRTRSIRKRNDRLQREIRERKQAEETLRHIVDVIAPTTGQDFFHTLALHLNQVCDVRYAFIAEVDPARSGCVRTIAASQQGRLMDNFTYDLHNTPCENVVGRALCFYATNVQQGFPEDILLAEMGIDSYMGTPLNSNTGKSLGLIVLMHDKPFPQPEHAKAMLQVVAARAAAELERKQVEAALRESETRYRIFADHAFDALFIRESGGRIVDVNRQACENLGYTRDELIGMTPAEICPEVTPVFIDALERRLTAGETVAFDSRHKRKDGSEFPVSIRIRPFMMNGQLLRFALARDITEQRKATENMRQHQAVLTHAQRLSSVGEMAASLAHELNQPLGAIRNYASVLQDLTLLKHRNGPVGKATTGLIEESERACEIMSRLRNFTRKRELHRSTININDVVRDAVRLTAAEARQMGITVAAYLDESIARIHADSVQIKQVVVNLITNALDAMAGLPPERRFAEVRTAHVAERERIQVAVTDSGTGIPNELRSSVFDSFITTKKEGLGLGLAISRSIIELHRGQLTMNDNPHGGMIFAFELTYGEPAQQS